tara:strand:- start:420 stop:1670 length:1251 start_codon:yes stop_codon:yes gene_type:complete
MKIWIITIGEPIINNKYNLRLHRSGLLSDFLSKSLSCEVVFWTSAFNHFKKDFEYNNDKVIEISPDLTQICLNGGGYKKNVSFSRFYDHYLIAKKFRKYSKQYSKPDLIISSFPTLKLCEEAVRYSKEHKVPVVIDYRDMWPEVFVELFPKKLEFIGKFLFYPLFRKTSKLFSNASALVSITDNLLEIMLRKSNDLNKNSFVLPLLYNKVKFDNKFVIKSIEDWNNRISNSNSIKICFFGTFGNQFDLKTVIDGIRLLKNKFTNNVELYLCGSGDNLEFLKKYSKDVENIFFPGYLNQYEILGLMYHCEIGLCPYKLNDNFLNSIPGKAIEYMYGGLDIITNLGDGKLGCFLKQNNFGNFYLDNNPESFANTIIEYINEKQEINLKKTKIKQVFKDNFDYDKLIPEFKNFLKKVKY